MLNGLMGRYIDYSVWGILRRYASNHVTGPQVFLVLLNMDDQLLFLKHSRDYLDPEVIA